jgi:hypothetical protein
LPSGSTAAKTAKVTSAQMSGVAFILVGGWGVTDNRRAGGRAGGQFAVRERLSASD